jgi:hypothetical protein
MYHYVYKTINLITNKVYIGAHSSDELDDGYLGSGKALKDAIQKHGKDNFQRVILEMFETREQAFRREAEIVTEEFIKEDTNYNMCPGGLGSTVKTEEFKQQVSNKLKGRKFTEEHSRKKSLAQTGPKNHRYGKSNPNNPKLSGPDNGMYGKKHTEDSINLMRQNRKGVDIEYTPELRNKLGESSRGKCWYNNGISSARFLEGIAPAGFVKGRLK